MTLNEIAKQSDFQIVKINKPSLKDRLCEMGLHRGMVGKLIQTLPFGGPLVLQAGSCMFALRREDAICIEIEKL